MAVARAAAMVAASFSKEAKEKQQKEHEEKLRELQLVLGDMYKVTSAFGEPRSVKVQFVVLTNRRPFFYIYFKMPRELYGSLLAFLKIV